MVVSPDFIHTDAAFPVRGAHSRHDSRTLNDRSRRDTPDQRREVRDD